MLTTLRKQQLLSRLKQDGKLIAKDLSLEMGVSEDTIRRDLRELAQEGLLQRVHGGALPSSPAVVDFAGREEIRHEGKAAIGRAAAAMIQSRSSRHPGRRHDLLRDCAAYPPRTACPLSTGTARTASHLEAENIPLDLPDRSDRVVDPIPH